MNVKNIKNYIHVIFPSYFWVEILNYHIYILKLGFLKQFKVDGL